MGGLGDHASGNSRVTGAQTAPEEPEKGSMTRGDKVAPRCTQLSAVDVSGQSKLTSVYEGWAKFSWAKVDRAKCRKRSDEHRCMQVSTVGMREFQWAKWDS